jgi:hypothetical protein
VPTDEECYEQVLHNIPLADDDFADLAPSSLS